MNQLPEHTQALLSSAEGIITRLLATAGTATRRVRISAGDVAIEWTGAGTLAPAGAPPAASGAPGYDTEPGPKPAESPNGRAAHHLRAPTVGTFYRAPAPGEPPFVRPGDTVRAGQQVAIVEAMKLMIPVEADAAGTIAEVLAEDGASVEYGTELFRLDPA
ncbi:biotin/lipoyl-containing protein [Dactylosporangium sp. AC04546]|uniref:acetyl-CoA carboxylase biotin carboxyl carrier protein n=1 Tax=Dactylosporangium sp. AC04546 TaxID=2862460 RepID=UPI001EDFD422|nr:biotin/lipoyl-containing protein [Dactylosporangium sp. AC04546]WVK79064.1 biotin/lipoyl-containing protein [Dactylosporangium sp. AC04546]